MKMSTSRNFNKSGVQPYRNLDDNVAKNVELSKIHLGKSSEPHKSSLDSQIDISTLDSKVCFIVLSTKRQLYNFSENLEFHV